MKAVKQYSQRVEVYGDAVTLVDLMPSEAAGRREVGIASYDSGLKMPDVRLVAGDGPCRFEVSDGNDGWRVVWTAGSTAGPGAMVEALGRIAKLTDSGSRESCMYCGGDHDFALDPPGTEFHEDWCPTAIARRALADQETAG